MKQKFVELYMDWAKRTAQLSHAKRLQVGSVIVKNECVISYGYNGMPAGWDNNCEMEVESALGEIDVVTRPEVLHAESNALAKLAKYNQGGLDADIFITHSPCLECAKLIFQSGIKCVYYGEDYRNDVGINFLRRSGVTVKKI
jgi:dCMP deaminase